MALMEPLHRGQKLNWNYPVNLIGDKVCDPDIHCCEICDLPILIYGRMLPCKHVFCYECAGKTEKHCPRCKDAVSRIERCDLGTIFLCTWGAPRYSHDGCRRTYLSERDLHAHVNHRHLAASSTPNVKATKSAVLTSAPQPSQQASSVPPGIQQLQKTMFDCQATNFSGLTNSMQVLNNNRGNLITIQLNNTANKLEKRPNILHTQQRPPFR